MDTIDDFDFINHWDELDAFARGVIRSAQGRLWPTLAISFIDKRPDLIVEAPVLVREESDAIVSVLVDFFAAVRPDRLAVFWPSRYELPDGSVYWALRVNSCEPGAGGRVWRTRVHPYTVDADTGAVELLDAFDLDNPPDPPSRRLRRIYARRTFRRLQARGVFGIPEADGWDLYAVPGSTTMEQFEYLGPASSLLGWPAEHGR